MTSAALQDLSNRIASNTLTGPQQAALVTALAVLIPDFPAPDEISNSIPSTEAALARAWIAALYTLQAQAQGGSSVLPTQQVAWFVNAVSGSDTNDGLTAQTPLKTIAALGALWKGTAGGGRPVLSPATGSTITVTLQTDIPVTDPLAPLLDVDLDSPGANPTRLIIKGAAKTAQVSSHLTTASAFARTSAGGQIHITDGGTANYGPFVGTASLFQDQTSGAIAWLYGPDTGSSATGTLSVGYSAQSPGVEALATQTAIAGADAYTLSDITHASIGQGFTTRSGPLSSTNVTGETAGVFFYRLHLDMPNDNAQLSMSSDGVLFTFQECQLDHEVVCNLGGLAFVNCMMFHALGFVAHGGGVISLRAGGVLSGQVNGAVQAQGGGAIFADQDFAVFSGTAWTAIDGGVLQLGQCSFWVNGSSTAALFVAGGVARFLPQLAASTVFYGTDSGTPLVVTAFFGSGGSIMYFNDSSGTPAAHQFQFTHSVFSVGELASSSFGFNATTGAYVGLTTNTFAHLDTALGAGTGFGGESLDPGSGSYLRLAA